MALIDIKVPDIGDFAEVTVIELLVKPGDNPLQPRRCGEKLAGKTRRQSLGRLCAAVAGSCG